MSRVRVSPTEWRDEGPSQVRTYAVGYTVRPALTVGSMVPFSAAMKQDVGPKRRAQMAEQKRRSRAQAPGRAHQGKVYETEEARVAARRATWRASKERARLAGA